MSADTERGAAARVDHNGDDVISTREKYRRIAEHRRYPKKKNYSFDELVLGLTAMEAGVNRYYAMHAGRPAKRVLNYLAQAAKAAKPETKAKALKLARGCMGDVRRDRHPELAEQIENRILWEEGWRPETWDAERNVPRTQGASVNPQTGVQEFFFDGANAPQIPEITVISQPWAKELGRQAVQVDLPGLTEPTFLDKQFAPMVEQFRQNAATRGVDLHFNSGYRTPKYQSTDIRNNPMSHTPATNSLHSAGLAVDVNFQTLPVDQQNAIREAAREAGLSWGGTFKVPRPDPVHFFYDPGGDRVKLINEFGQRVQRLKNQPVRKEK